jgi:hypothetical protein
MSRSSGATWRPVKSTASCVDEGAQFKSRSLRPIFALCLWESLGAVMFGVRRASKARRWGLSKTYLKQLRVSCL